MLPIEPILPELSASLAKTCCAVLVAPPGAGKTTRVPLALMAAPWARDGRIILLEPRRLAARAAAARMAESLGEAVGERVGLRVRFQTLVSPRTRIEVVTEGVFTRMALSDPTLSGISTVIFDEFHERSLDADLGLAFARDVQLLLRDDLRLVVMSATLDGASVARLLGDAPVIRSEGRSFPVATRHVSRDASVRMEAQVARVVRRALAAEPGSVLVFLPGQGEIRRVARELEEGALPDNVTICPLYGALTPAEQDLAIRPAPSGHRKVVLATSIAETSLTIEGVRVVIDGGLARVPRFQPATGLTRLETVRVSRAGADQRRGRAGRTEPGVCYRLWDESETGSLPPFATPEIRECDLSGLALALAEWGVRDASGLALLDRPPAGAFQEARALLQRLGALTEAGDLSAHGRHLAALPLPPRLADMVIRGAGGGQADIASGLAAVLTERGLGGTSTDLSERLKRFKADASPRARDIRQLSERWARTATSMAVAASSGKRSRTLEISLLVAHAFPDRIAQKREGADGEFRLASGRGARLDPTDPLARQGWLAVAELTGTGQASDRITLASPLDPVALAEAFDDQLEHREAVEIDAAGRARLRRQTRIGELILTDRIVERPDRKRLAKALLDHVVIRGLHILDWGDAATDLRRRVAFASGLDPSGGWPDLSFEALIGDAAGWLEPLLEQGGLSNVSATALEAVLRDRIGWARLRELDRLAPERLATPAGPSHRIDYGAEGGPRVEVRVQELFGLKTHPCVGEGRISLTVALTSPAHRPIQITRDLPGFWAGSWRDVRAEMKGRYPRHPWPEDPAAALPTTRAKPRGT
jgi:ATP-dependent helicase HrpB